jgi:hypothetical protein
MRCTTTVHAMAKVMAAGTVAAGLVLAGAAGPVNAAPSVASPPGQLYAVSASSAVNAWAVGCRLPSPTCPAGGVEVAYHWNGRAWKQASVPEPSGSAGGELTGVKVISSANAWAVGNNTSGAQIVHWNGNAWKRAAVPALPAPWGTSYTLNSVAASSASDVWAVGTGGSNGTVILHYNGTTWRRVAGPGS